MRIIVTIILGRNRFHENREKTTKRELLHYSNNAITITSLPLAHIVSDQWVTYVCYMV